MFDPGSSSSRPAASPENPVAADVQRRGLRELRKLPGSGAAASGAAASTKRTHHDTLQKSVCKQGGPEEGGDALPRPRQFRMSEPIISSSVATEQAKLFHAIGMDLLHSLPEAAHGYVQRALRTAPKESWLLSEIMGSACVTLNRLKRHSEALRMAEQACELLKRGQQPTVQLAAMLHNKSACHEYLGDNASALQARIPCCSAHSHPPVPPCALFAPTRPLHPPLHLQHPPLPSSALLCTSAPSPCTLPCTLPCTACRRPRRGCSWPNECSFPTATSSSRASSKARRPQQQDESAVLAAPQLATMACSSGCLWPRTALRCPSPPPHPEREAVAPPSASPVAAVAAAAPLLEAKL